MTENFYVAEAELAIAERYNDGTLDAYERLLLVRRNYERARKKQNEEMAFAFILEALAEHCQAIVANADGFLAVRQSAAKFVAPKPDFIDDDGWRWPVVVVEAGWTKGSIEDAKTAVPFRLGHYFTPEAVAQVARVTNGARFRRKHPERGDGADSPELICGWMSDSRMEGTKCVATANLMRNEDGIRSILLAAREAGKLDLFGVSILAYFDSEVRIIEGREAIVPVMLRKLSGVDLVAEPGAGGVFLP